MCIFANKLLNLPDISHAMAENEKEILENLGEREYKYGFTSAIETETIGKGLSEEVVRLISEKYPTLQAAATAITN